MTSATAILLLGLGVGALVVGPRGSRRSPLRERATSLRGQASRAQEASARASGRARELMDQWIAAESAAREAGQ